MRTIDRLSLDELEPRVAPAPLMDATILLAVDSGTAKLDMKSPGGGPPTTAPTDAADAATADNVHVPWHAERVKIIDPG